MKTASTPAHAARTAANKRTNIERHLIRMERKAKRGELYARGLTRSIRRSMWREAQAAAYAD